LRSHKITNDSEKYLADDQLKTGYMNTQTCFGWSCSHDGTSCA